ncbi:SDR family NAD(P)-dependent oxidoreductase [Sulfuriroseicoccus oceanibius]|uniref:SDR family NAD(P)-dependent oxidoreductase n=1 Tax=Sulfuriroseicoccus oceanibius TaxID=2707525 RepID=A0A6B3LEL6_9BACT|nr:SDR family NAD(P)-dependent oxidoreductase [Sulfuriroseicoccus oceanibius]QQL44920.1 SDR family NAD(P)-dependent oxidoreductase [Sulfuriroseicoccus oceanibius]
MKILITGGAGFIGSHTARRFGEMGHEIVVLDDFNDYYDPSIKRENVATRLPEGSVVIEGDIRDKEAVKEAFSHGIDAVIHLAARAGVRPSLEDPELYISTNISGTFNILEAARDNGVKKVLFASSSSVYGVNDKVPFAEDDLLQRTISPYAMTKLAGEHMCSNFSHLYGMQIVCLRFFTVYGPGQRPDLAIHKFSQKIWDGTPIDQYGDGSTRRDYTYIDDIVDGIVGSFNYNDKPFEILNLGESQTTTLKELIEGIESAIGKKAQINLMPEQPGDVPRTFADISKAKELIGYNPQTKIKEGLPKFAEWFIGRQQAK